MRLQRKSLCCKYDLQVRNEGTREAKRKPKVKYSKLSTITILIV